MRLSSLTDGGIRLMTRTNAHPRAPQNRGAPRPSSAPLSSGGGGMPRQSMPLRRVTSANQRALSFGMRSWVR